MALTLERVLPFSKSLLEKIVSAGETVIDATAGNGYDTLFLAKLVGESGKVFSFDVQQEAIDSKNVSYTHLTLPTTPYV